MYTIRKITSVSKTVQKFPTGYNIYTRAGYQGEIPFTSYEDLIMDLGESGNLVLDFSCGTSHVAEACAKLGQDFVGLETDLRLYKKKIGSVKKGFGYAIV